MTLEEFDRLMLEAIGEATTIDSSIGGRVRDMLLDAAQAGRDWADYKLDAAQLHGCQTLAKEWNRKRNTGAFLGHDGRLLDKPIVAGIKHRKDSGEIAHQQKLYVELSWNEFREHARRILTQIEGLQVRADGIARLLLLADRFPQSFGPSEACTLAGTTIEAVLAGEVAA